MVAVVTVAVVVILVAKVLVWAEAVINMLVEELVIDVRVGVEIIVTIDLELIDALAGGVTIGVLPGIGVDVLADVNLNRFVVSMTSFEFVVPGPLEEEEFRC